MNNPVERIDETMNPEIPETRINDDKNLTEFREKEKVKLLIHKKCKFIIVKKKRPCQLVAMKGHDYCAEHYVDESFDKNSEHRRIPCPYDPKHTCCIRFLEDHKKRCNMRPKPAELYYSSKLNSSQIHVTETEGKNLSDLTKVELDRLIHLICTVYKNKIPKIKSSIGNFHTMQDDINTPGFGHKAKRHLIQVSSLLSVLQTKNLLHDSTCFVELGSGKGLLTYHLAQGVQVYVKTPETCRFILIDRASHRHKRDNKLKDTQIIVERLRVDLGDFALGNLDSICQCQNTVGFSKHLCGEATDMALKCVLENNSKIEKVKGIVIATCCHHKCSWGPYVGKKYLEEWGFRPEDFIPLTGISSWAVCGTGKSGFDESEWNMIEIDWTPNCNLELSSTMKRTLGTYVKRILDYGRVLYINTFGFTTALSTYASLEDTLENVAMIATKLE